MSIQDNCKPELSPNGTWLADGVKKPEKPISKYYQLTGLSAKACNYLFLPVEFLFQTIHDPKIKMITKIALAVLAIILSLPIATGSLLCAGIYYFSAEKIDRKTYDTQWNAWNKEKVFQYSLIDAGGALQRFIDFCIKNRISPKNCPYTHIGPFTNTANALPYLFTQPDSYFVGLDKDTEEGKKFLIAAELSKEDFCFKNKFIQNEENGAVKGKLPCGFAILEKKEWYNRFSQSWIQSAIANIKDVE